MQTGYIEISPPIAAEQGITTDEIQRPADDRAVIFGHHKQHLVSHIGPQLMKNLMRQIGTAPFAIDGRHVKAIEIIDMAGSDVIAGQAQQTHPGIGDGAPFLANILALA